MWTPFDSTLYGVQVLYMNRTDPRSENLVGITCPNDRGCNETTLVKILYEVVIQGNRSYSTVGSARTVLYCTMYCTRRLTNCIWDIVLE
jgi:hypothetical protein